MQIQVSEIPDEGLRLLDPAALPRVYPDPSWTLDAVDLRVERQGEKVTIAGRFDATETEARPHSHGTAMAGAIASRDRLLGVAPGARILAVRAFSETQASAEATTLTILKGIEVLTRYKTLRCGASCRCCSHGIGPTRARQTAFLPTCKPLSIFPLSIFPSARQRTLVRQSQNLPAQLPGSHRVRAAGV